MATFPHLREPSIPPEAREEAWRRIQQAEEARRLEHPTRSADEEGVLLTPEEKEERRKREAD